MPWIHVDFNTETAEPIGMLKIYEPETLLTDGETVIAYDEELEVQARVTYDPAIGMWLAVPNWTTKHGVIEPHA